MVRSNRKTSGGGACCRGQRGGDAHRRQCGAGRKRQSAGKHCTGQAGGHVHNKHYGGARKGKGKRGSRSRGRGRSRSRGRGRGKRASRKIGGYRKTYSVRGGACNASSVDLGHTLDLSDNIRGHAAVVRQRGGDAHGDLRYDCKQPDWGPECR